MNRLNDVLKTVPADVARMVNEELDRLTTVNNQLYGALSSLYMAVAAQYPFQSQHVTVEMRRVRKILENMPAPVGVPGFLVKDSSKII